MLAYYRMLITYPATAGSLISLNVETFLKGIIYITISWFRPYSQNCSLHFLAVIAALRAVGMTHMSEQKILDSRDITSYETVSSVGVVTSPTHTCRTKRLRACESPLKQHNTGYKCDAGALWSYCQNSADFSG